MGRAYSALPAFCAKKKQNPDVALSGDCGIDA
jgi:hypothetical protein